MTEFLVTTLILSSFFFAPNDAADEDYISPARPTVSGSATIQKKAFGKLKRAAILISTRPTTATGKRIRSIAILPPV